MCETTFTFECRGEGGSRGGSDAIICHTNILVELSFCLQRVVQIIVLSYTGRCLDGAEEPDASLDDSSLYKLNAARAARLRKE